ncbi:hypothetical protein LPJ73_002454 [Coemansia sp. RSA 2703]|nr:hypothetical protein LPJ73_002454 [Coemansia sp. RSA 2703]
MYSWMLDSNYAKLVFTSARSLVISQHVCSSLFCLADIDTGVAVQNISVMLRLFRMMTPNISEIDLQWRRIEYPDAEGDQYSPLMRAISDIISNTKSVTIDSKSVFHKTSFTDMTLPSNLVSFTYTFGFESSWCNEVIRRNSQSLKRLELWFYTLNETRIPLYDETENKPIVYSSLDTLKLLYAGKRSFQSLRVPDNTGSLANPRTVHFPYLHVFESTIPYPFTYNVLPEKLPTLQRLSIYMPEDIYESHPSFEHLASSRFPNLRELRILAYLNYTNRMVQPKKLHDSAMLKFVSKTTDPTSLRCFKVDFLVDKSVFFKDAYMLAAFAGLRSVEMQYVTLLFSEIVWLLETAPCLEQLLCGLHYGAPNIDGVRPENLPEYIYKMRPLNNRFACLKIDDDFGGLPPRGHIKTALLLAIGCPRFTRLSYPFMNNDGIRKVAEKVMNTKSFVNYAEAASSFINGLRF